MTRAAAWAAAFVVTMATLAAARPIAQGRNWWDPYDKGVDAFKHQKWQDAVDNLEKAIAIDPRQDPDKRTDGVYGEPYFPYYYLGVAYLKLGTLDRADASFKKADSYGHMPSSMTRDLATAEADLRAAQTQAQTALPQKPPAAPDPALTRTAQLVQQGATALAAGRLTEASSAFTEARRLTPGSPEARDGLQTIATRRSAYATARAAAFQDETALRFADAVKELQHAKDADSEEYAADALDARRQADERASAVPPVSPPPASRAAGPVPHPSTVASAPPPRPTPPIREALAAYLEGDLERAVALLRPSAGDASLDATTRAQVHTYLAVAYAEQALEASSASAADPLREQALAEFRTALAADPRVELSQKLISPKIQALLNTARGR